MKPLSKYLKLVALFIIIFHFSLGCSKDDSDELFIETEKSIYGKWEYYADIYKWAERQHEGDYFFPTYEFIEPDSFILTQYFTGRNDIGVIVRNDRVYKGFFSYEQDSITLTTTWYNRYPDSQRHEEYSVEVEFNGDEMKWTGENITYWQSVGSSYQTGGGTYQTKLDIKYLRRIE